MEDVTMALKIHFWLTFACKGGREAWSPPSGLLLQVEEGAALLKHKENIVKRRWRRQKSTSGSLLHMREVEGGQHC